MAEVNVYSVFLLLLLSCVRYVHLCIASIYKDTLTIQVCRENYVIALDHRLQRKKQFKKHDIDSDAVIFDTKLQYAIQRYLQINLMDHQPLTTQSVL